MSDGEVDDVQLAREWIGSEPVFTLFQWHGDSFALPAMRGAFDEPAMREPGVRIHRGHHAHLGMQFHVEMTPSLVMDGSALSTVNAKSMKRSNVRAASGCNARKTLF